MAAPPASTAALKLDPAAGQPPRPGRPSPRRAAAAPPCRVVLRQPSHDNGGGGGGGGGGAHAQALAEEMEVDEAAFMGRFMALRQFLELARQHAATKGGKGSKGVLPTWRLKLSRAALVSDVLAEFGKRKGSSWVYMPTQVTLLDAMRSNPNPNPHPHPHPNPNPNPNPIPNPNPHPIPNRNPNPNPSPSPIPNPIPNQVSAALLNRRPDPNHIPFPDTARQGGANHGTLHWGVNGTAATTSVASASGAASSSTTSSSITSTTSSITSSTSAASSR